MTWDMPIRPIESGPLSNREIKELHAFLLAEDELENPRISSLSTALSAGTLGAQ